MPFVPGQTCTLCTWCQNPLHVGPAAHIEVRHPSCTMEDEKHKPKKPGCTCTYNEETRVWTHGANCPIHP